MSNSEDRGTVIYWGGFELPDKNAAAHRVAANARILEDLGYKLVFLGVTSDDIAGLRQSAANIFEEAHPHSNRAWLNRLCSLKSLRCILSQFRDAKAIILYNLPFITLLRVRLAFPRLKVFYDCTELTPDTDGSRLKKWFKRLDCYALTHWMPKVADAIIAISSRMEGTFASQNAKLLRLPPLVDIDSPIWRQAKLPHPGTFEFLYAGVLDNNKDRLDTILDAFHSLANPTARLRIIGITREDFAEYCPQAKGLLDDNRVIFMGRLAHFETVRYVLSCDCYIFIRPSDVRNNMGFPTKYVEALTCGVPIIATNISDIGDYVSENVLIIPDMNKETISSAMERAIEKPLGNGGINGVFHYGNYRQAFEAWLGKVL